MPQDTPHDARVQAVPRYVFVYGTLRRGEVNDINLLQPAPRYVGSGVTMGSLYQMGWYPGLILGGDAHVTGEVYEITPALERRLDEIEEVWPEPTNEYFKRMILVEVDGVARKCVVYEINPERIAGKGLIAAGNWLERH